MCVREWHCAQMCFARVRFLPQVRVAVVNLFVSEARAKLGNLCKFAALLVLRGFLPVHAIVRGVFAPLTEEISQPAARPWNALLCARGLAYMLEMLQEFRQDARFVPLVLYSCLTLQVYGCC